MKKRYGRGRVWIVLLGPGGREKEKSDEEVKTYWRTSTALYGDGDRLGSL